MADKRISELPKISSIQDNAMLVVELNGTAYHLTGAQLKAYVATGGGTGNGDMARSVYDPQGKNTDIFRYVDETVLGGTW